MEEPQVAEEGTEPTAVSAPAPAEPTQTTVGGGKNIVIPSNALKSRIDAAAERGRRAAAGEFEQQAKAAGFGSVADMFAAVAEMRTRGNKARSEDRSDTPKPERAEAKPAEDERRSGNGRSFKEQARADRRVEQERQRSEQERRARIREERRRKEIEAERDSLEAEMSLREAAIMNGVKDVDYAVTLLKRSIAGKSPEELKGYDENKFYADLRGQHPYLFGEVVKPVTTGVSSGNAPTAPRPGKVVTGTADGSRPDAKKMNGVEFRDRLSQLGLSMDIAGE